MGLVFKYGSEKDAIKFMPPDANAGLEFWITNKVREIRDKADNLKHKIGVLSGHDEIKLSDANLVPSQEAVRRVARRSRRSSRRTSPSIRSQDVDLKAGDSGGEIDDRSLDGLIITQPAGRIADRRRSLRRIDQFMMKGKSLAVFASAVNEKPNDATMTATLSTHGLEKLLDGYGVTMNKDVVLDFGRSFHVNMITQGGIASVRFPDVVDVQDDSRMTGNEMLLDTAFPAFFRLPEVVIPFASSLTLHSDKQPEAKMSIVARSTPKSIVETGDTVDLKPFKKVDAERATAPSSASQRRSKGR